MLDAAVKALSQMFSPPFRTVLAKSIGLALLLIVLFGIGLHRLLIFFTGAGEGWAEGVFGPNSHMPILILAKMLSVAAALGIVFGSVFLMPGGLGVAEGGLTALGQFLLGLPKDLATVATLTTGYVYIRRKQRGAHKSCMVASVVLGAAFLAIIKEYCRSNKIDEKWAG